MDDARRIAELERKIGQLTMENDFFLRRKLKKRNHSIPVVLHNGGLGLRGRHGLSVKIVRLCSRSCRQSLNPRGLHRYRAVLILQHTVDYQKPFA